MAHVSEQVLRSHRRACSREVAAPGAGHGGLAFCVRHDRSLRDFIGLSAFTLDEICTSLPSHLPKVRRLQSLSHIPANTHKSFPHMSLTENRLKALDNPALTRNERVLLRCRLASEFIHLGQYASAQAALGTLWQGVGQRPNIERLKPLTAAEVLLQCGALSGWLGSLHDISGAQEQAKDLIHEANRLISGVIQELEKGSHNAGLTDALTLQGVIHARLGLHDSSIKIFREAMSVGQTRGDAAQAGRAALAMLEEHGRDRLSTKEVIDLYLRADDLLKDTLEVEDMTRLRACARIVTARAVGKRLSDRDFRLPEVVCAYEAAFIREALEAEGGVVTRAAARLGLSHQTLIEMLKGRHQELSALRTPARKRRESLMRRDSSVKKEKRMK